MVLDEVHHRAEVSTQRSTAAWSSSSCLRNRASHGVQEENSREGSCNLGVLWSCVPPLNCVLPLKSVGEGCSITWFFSDALIPTRTGLRDVLSSEVVVSRPETQSLMDAFRISPDCLPKTRWKNWRPSCCSDVFAVMWFFMHDRVRFSCGFWVRF